MQNLEGEKTRAKNNLDIQHTSNKDVCLCVYIHIHIHILVCGLYIDIKTTYENTHNTLPTA